MKVKLQHVAHTRSGDKGDTSNIAVFAFEPEFYPLLKAQLTADRFKAYYAGAIKGEVIRHEVDNIEALNFVCHGALGGGVSRSLCLDNYGKALSAAVLGFEIEVPEALRPKLHGKHLLGMTAMTSKKKHTILVAGASGVVGAAAVEHFAPRPDWRVLALSRRRPAQLPDGVEHVPLDLADAAACRSAADNLRGVTHLMYAALFELPDLVAGWRDPRQMAVNDAMLRNLLDALEPAARGLRHVTLMQGTKAYGGHVEPAPVPAKERWPRHDHANFYWLQEDLLRERQPKAGWVFTVLRPQIIFGFSVGSPMNIVGAIGAYAAVMRERGLPLRFPGGGRYINGASDSRLIAQAAEFAGTHEIAANETYNVVNGDALLWHDLWRGIAERFGMPAGEPEPTHLASEMPKQEAAWARVVERHGLQPLTLEQLVGSSWQFTDRAFAHGITSPAHSVLSPIKLRQHGFAGCEDTEDSLHRWLERMQAERLLPR